MRFQILTLNLHRNLFPTQLYEVFLQYLTLLVLGLHPRREIDNQLNLGEKRY